VTTHLVPRLSRSNDPSVEVILASASFGPVSPVEVSFVVFWLMSKPVAIRRFAIWESSPFPSIASSMRAFSERVPIAPALSDVVQLRLRDGSRDPAPGLLRRRKYPDAPEGGDKDRYFDDVSTASNSDHH
jgi:hypothetical protein